MGIVVEEPGVIIACLSAIMASAELLRVLLFKCEFCDLLPAWNSTVCLNGFCFFSCLSAANPMIPITTAMTPNTLQQWLSSQQPPQYQPPSPFFLCRQASRPRRKSSPVGWPYSSACWLLVSSILIAPLYYICLTWFYFLLKSVIHQLHMHGVLLEASSLVSV